MVDKLEFYYSVKKAGLTTKEVADNLNISLGSLYLKINGKRDFKLKELRVLYEILNLDTAEKQQAVFFA
jgi:predicted transcriptional regulator